MNSAIKTGRPILYATRGSRHSEHLREFAALREGVISAAVKAKKIPEERADDYRKMFTASPIEIHRLLTAKPEDGGLVAGAAGPGAAPPDEDSYPAEWLPEVAAQQQGGRVAGDVSTVAATPAAPSEDEPAYPPGWLPEVKAGPTGDVPRVTEEP